MLKKFGEFQLDEGLRRLSRGGQPVKLTGQALDLLCLLVRRPGELVSREEIKHNLWPDTNVDSEHSLDVLLNRLRAILGDSGKIPRYIETVPKRGYRFLAHVDCGQSPSNRQFIDNSVRRLWIYAAIALLAAAIAVLIVRTRYQKFIPPKQNPVSTSPCSSGRMTVHNENSIQRFPVKRHIVTSRSPS
jgi:DNA-binding winged helix-turn-helix (wHTH) protein